MILSKPETSFYNIDQPDIFEPYKREEQIGQPRPIQTSQNNNFKSQNPSSTQSDQPTQTHNKTPMPFYLQQHEITKRQLKIFRESQLPQNQYR